MIIVQVPDVNIMVQLLVKVPPYYIQVSIFKSEVKMPISFPSLLLPKSSLDKPIHGARKRTPDPHIAPFYNCHTGLPTTYGRSYPEDLLDLAIFADDQSQLSPLLLVKCTGP